MRACFAIVTWTWTLPWLLGGCGDGHNDPAADQADATGPCATLMPRLGGADGLQACVFFPRCGAFGTCHGGSEPAERLSLADREATCASLVDAPSRRQPEHLLVASGDPAASYLLDKLQGLPGLTGERMPAPPVAPLTTPEIDAVRAWVAAGASCLDPP